MKRWVWNMILPGERIPTQTEQKQQGEVVRNGLYKYTIALNKIS